LCIVLKKKLNHEVLKFVVAFPVSQAR